MALSVEEREQFLAEPHIGALSVVERPDRAVIGTAAGSTERSREMAARYLPPDKVADFLEYERTHLDEHVTVYMRPEHWLSADLGPAW